METLTFKAFRAVEQPQLCQEFLHHHRQVLEEFGIANVTTNSDYWVNDPDTYVITATSSIHGMVGGIRVEVDKGRRPLPIESALRSLDPAIGPSMRLLREAGNGEVCGLWNSSKYTARGLPSMLAFAAVSLANQIGLKSLVCLVAHYTLRHAVKVGFTVIEDVGHGGTFTYPIPSIKAIAMVIPDVLTMASANSDSRRRLMSLRMRPEQESLESLNGSVVMCKYELCIDKKVLDLVAYVNVLRMHHNYAASA